MRSSELTIARFRQPPFCFYRVQLVIKFSTSTRSPAMWWWLNGSHVQSYRTDNRKKMKEAFHSLWLYNNVWLWWWQLRVTRAVTAITVLNMTLCKPGKSSIKKLTEISSGKCNPFLYQLGLESDYSNHLIKGGPIPGSFCRTFKLVCTCDNLQEHYFFKSLKTKCSNPRKKRLEKFRPCCTKRSQRLTLSGACATLIIKSHSFRANIWVWSSSESLMPLCSRRKTSSLIGRA